MQGTVLIVDDQIDLSGFLARLIKAEGFEVHTAPTGAEARRLVAETWPDIILLDIRLPDADGIELLKEFKAEHPAVQVIMMTAHGSIRTAVESTRVGAFEYLTKPFEPDEMLVALRNALSGRFLREEVSHLRKKKTGLAGEDDRSLLDFPSAAMRQVRQLAEQAGRSDVTVLLLGESGTGKNHLAGWIHRHSPRAEGPFFDVNCASLAPSLIESELFGHEPGAFTGSQGRKRGLLELADGGTLFLDEIGELDLALQARLLAFLDTKTFRRVGGEVSIKVDARIIAATNRDLESLVKQEKFRSDLFYRLNVFPFLLPPLRERMEDAPILARVLLDRLAREAGLSAAPQLAESALLQIAAYNFPGNVRELRNLLERTLFSEPGQQVIRDLKIQPRNQDLPQDCGVTSTCFVIEFPPQGVALKATLNQLTADLINEALRRSKTKKEAAELLDITRNSLAHYLKTIDIKD